VLPQLGENTLSFCIASRPDALQCGIVLEYVELIIRYATFPRAAL
jgi:hypothetical protein